MIQNRFILLAMALLLILPSAAGCNTAKKVNRTLSLNNLHIRAAMAEDKGDDQLAYELWSEYVDRRPQSELAEYRLGMVETRLGLYQQAAGHLQIAHDLQPGNTEYLNALADALVAQGDQNRLMELLRQSVDEGDGVSGYLRMAQYAQRAGMLDEAHDAIKLAIVNARGQTVDPYLAMANFAKQTNDADAEILNLRYALWFDRSNTQVLNRLESLGLITGPSLALKPVF